ncbi:unnamed protein product [Zymoseptoria tritici ST99CH_1A5]|uniref:Uncharacterized protein n=3 Tax=Zymoseptoria tritici TaxID=1047171 RepID=A0A1X7RLU2_ZYMT9|nr:unnamed protein product [Zymoseptoria tritici ST99CH_3D7]SMR48167.1 unnamed protein product [Zymoseptoria tritici ST99CH_1E4]SMY22075.1 unnamed protein product [Zymoseptoria tritici ST99CH_1A5]
MPFTKTSNVIVAALLTALPVLGQNTGFYYEPTSAGGSGIDHNYALFTAAGESANNTRSVTFPGFSGETWTWRVNISNVAVPDAIQAFPSEQPPLVDPKIVYVTYDIQWPGAETLNEKINQSESDRNQGQGREICMTAYDVDVRARYANQYKESDNGDCESIFGDNCTAGLMSALRSSSGGCQSPGPFPQSCIDRFLPADEGYNRGASTQGLGNGTAQNGTAANGESYNETESGSPFRFWLGNRDFGRGQGRGAVNGTNTTLFDEELSRVQMLALTGFPDGQSRLMCLRVSTEKTSGGNMLKASGVTVLSAVGLAIMSAAFAVL